MENERGEKPSDAIPQAQQSTYPSTVKPRAAAAGNSFGLTRYRTNYKRCFGWMRVGSIHFMTRHDAWLEFIQHPYSRGHSSWNRSKIFGEALFFLNISKKFKCFNEPPLLWRLVPTVGWIDAYVWHEVRGLSVAWIDDAGYVLPLDIKSRFDLKGPALGWVG